MSSGPARVEVAPSGAILLGPGVACDGFHRDYRCRVQTHVHLDHMAGLDTSKGSQDIFLTPMTRRLLEVEYNADLPIRQNLKTVEFGKATIFKGHRIELLSAGHMLGAAQVCVQTGAGERLGYSGDFQWPLETPIQVDQLVVDSTGGSPNRVRGYTQEDAERRLLEIVTEKLRTGPVHIKAHRGTISRGLRVLSEIGNAPIVGSRKLCARVEVHRDYGYAIPEVTPVETEEGKVIVRGGRYLRAYTTGDRDPIDPQGATVVLSAYMTDPGDPVMEYSERSSRVALSDHADYEGTLEYVRATGASFVVTDNSRGGHAVELARALERELGVRARPSEVGPSLEWGV